VVVRTADSALLFVIPPNAYIPLSSVTAVPKICSSITRNTRQNKVIYTLIYNLWLYRRKIVAHMILMVLGLIVYMKP